MRKLKLLALASMLAGVTVAMPTKEEFAKVRADVVELTAEMDAAGVRELVAKAETEASKYLLLCKAAELHVKGSDYAAAATDLESLYLAIPDVEPSAVVGEVQKVARGLKAKDAPQLLDLLRRSQALDKELRSKSPNLQVQAELRASVGQWSQAQELFAKQGGEVAKMVENETELKDISAVADFWWGYEPKTAVAGAAFRKHAAQLYQVCLNDELVKAPLKIALMKKRIAQTVAENENAGSVKSVALEDNASRAGAASVATVPAAMAKPLTIKLKTGIELELVPCPAGSFEMGHNQIAKSPECRHKVTITRPFWMGKYQISRKVFSVYDASMARMGAFLESTGGYDVPQTDVPYSQILKFLEWLNHRYRSRLPKGYVFRLPTEAEWEYALNANGGTPGNAYVRWRDGDKAVEDEIMVTKKDVIDLIKKGGGNPSKWGPWVTRIMSVGTKKPNDWGIFDLLGNGAEFTMDTLSEEGWQGRYMCNPSYDDLAGKGLLVYAEEEVDPVRFVDAAVKGKSGGTTCPIVRDSWYKKWRVRSNSRFGTYVTFRVVAGPDLLAEKNCIKK